MRWQTLGLVLVSLLVSSLRAEAQNLILTGSQTDVRSGIQRFDNVCLTGNAVLTVTNYDAAMGKVVTGNLELIAGSIYVGPNAKIVARGAGYQPSLCSAGAGMTSTAGGRGGCSVMDSGGGGAHFGRGGRGTVDNPTCLPVNSPPGDCTDAVAANLWRGVFPTAFEDDCKIAFNSTTSVCTTVNTDRRFCFRSPPEVLPLPMSPLPPYAEPTRPSVGDTVAGLPYWHNIYDREFGAAGGDKGCRDGDGRDTAAGNAYGNPVGGGGGGRVVLVGLSERNPSAVAIPLECQGVTRGTGPTLQTLKQGDVWIDGTIDAGGKRGCGVGNDSGGGGGGGSVLIVGENVYVAPTSTVSAAGALGGDTRAGANTQPNYLDCPAGSQTSGTCDDCGGGGGGGIISVLSLTSDLDPGAAFNVNGANGGTCDVCLGEAGGGAGELQLDGAYVGEYCDGYDNDFDGNVDENLPMQTCGRGSCAQMIPSCQAGVPLACNPTLNGTDCRSDAEGAHPRVSVILDTSASMLLNLDGLPTFGDGSVERPGIDTPIDADTVANDSRLQLAREALGQVMSAYPEIDFALARYHQDQAIDRSCQSAKWFECQSLVATYDDPTGNTGAQACSLTWPATTATPTPLVLNVNSIPGPAGSECINYAGSCGGPRRGADILSGFGSNVRDMVRWLDGRETMFNPAMTSGDVCLHSAGNDCEVRGSGPTPLAGSLQAIEDYIVPIRTVDSALACRGYSVILLTDGAESCDGQPAAAAQRLHDELDIEVYVVAVSVLDSERESLTAIAASGSGSNDAAKQTAHGHGTRPATFVTDPEDLVPALSEIIAGAIRSEACNGADDDCDSLIDEDFPALGSACDDGEQGLCRGTGTRVCNLAGTGTTCQLSSQGAMSVDEICNMFDDDCDAKIDEGLTCGSTPCTGTGEVCNAVDDDCDGLVDESDPMLDSPCGEDRGQCESGRLRCIAGTLQCVGGVLPSSEQCNGRDDDCDGDPDDDAPCPPSEVCVEGSCRRTCDPVVEFSCPVGYLCTLAADPVLGYLCLPGACALCKSTEICENDVCLNPCEGVSCEENERCVLGSCQDCNDLGCGSGQVCFERMCQSDPCRGVTCDAAEFCFKGDCIPVCDEQKCAPGERCGAMGECESDPCVGVACDEGEVCRAGSCAQDACAGVGCPSGDVCVGELGCIANPCPITQCQPGASCEVGDQGQPTCVGAAAPAPRPSRYVSAGGSGLCSLSAPGSGGATGGGALAWSWLVMPAWAWSWRRRKLRARRAPLDGSTDR